MGCCEARNAQDQTINLQTKKIFNLNNLKNFDTIEKSETKCQNHNVDKLKFFKKAIFILI